MSAQLARLRRAPPYPWQLYVNDVAGEINDDGTGFAYPIVVLSVPRRAGKTVDVLATCCDRMELVPDCRGWYTAQRREDAAKQWRDEWVPMLEPLERIYRLRHSQGSEGFRRRGTSARTQLFPPTETALHGQNADIATVDEAWWFDAVTGEAVENGIRPAQLTRPWRQLWIVSAGGTIESTWLDDWITAGESNVPGVALFDFGADASDPDYDPGNPRTWATHPAVGYGIGLEAIAAEYATAQAKKSMTLFERSILNVWPRPSLAVVQAGVDLVAWQAAARPAVTADAWSALAVDVSRDRSWASVAGAGWAGERLVIEVLEHRPGIGWISDAVKRIRRTQRRSVPVVADSLVAASIVNELTRAFVAVVPIGATDHARACQTFLDLLTTGILSHRSQRALDEAITAATRRPLGDAWLWSRARSPLDISPLVACTLAAGAGHSRRPTGRAGLGSASGTATAVEKPESGPGAARQRRPR